MSRQQNKLSQDKINKLNDSIYRCENKIEKLMNRIAQQLTKHQFKINLTQYVGQDRDYHRYWFISKHNAQLFVEKEVENQTQWAWVELKDQSFKDFYESLNPKGIREKKLQENLAFYNENEFFNYEKNVPEVHAPERVMKDVFDYNMTRAEKTQTRRSAKKSTSTFEQNIHISLELPLFKQNMKNMDAFFSTFLKKRNMAWKKEDIMALIEEADTFESILALF